MPSAAPASMMSASLGVNITAANLTNKEILLPLQQPPPSLAQDNQASQTNKETIVAIRSPASEVVTTTATTTTTTI